MTHLMREAKTAAAPIPPVMPGVVQEARDILRGSAGLSVLLGGALGLLFGYQLPTLVPGQFEWMTQWVLGLVLGKSATLCIAIIMALRMAFRFRFAAAAELAGYSAPRLLTEVFASLWGMLLGYALFIMAALAGFAAGIELSGTVSAHTAWYAIEQNYSLGHFARGILRLAAEAVLLGWLAYLAQWLASLDTPLSLRASPIVLLSGFVLGLLAIEVLDTLLGVPIGIG